jgi:DNA-binding transcriptional ArsR family regulator
MAIPELVEHLSQGLEIQEVSEQEQVILAPSFWGTPFSFFGYPQPKCLLITFGARPADASLIPGEAVPDRLLQTLKALADPTRLRILYYLAQERLTPTELARRLRLRPPTVIHHLNALRLAGLVEITLHAEGERGYALRREALNDVLSLLVEFLTPDQG